MKVLPELPLGPGECPTCERAVVWALDELGRRLAFDAQQVPGGLFVVGLEMDSMGDEPAPGPHARLATGEDSPARRWDLHVCEHGGRS